MITFKSRCETIRNADRITRYVNSVYPHVSESKSKEIISRYSVCANLNDTRNKRLRDLALQLMLKMKALRYNYTSGIELLRKIIRSLKDAKLGNCYEAAKMAELIGKVNGLKNIYPMKICVTRNRSGAMLPADHVVAVITEEKIKPDSIYNFKKTDAVIIDPWLGITEFASKYCELLKNDFIRWFPNIPDNDFNLKFLEKVSKNPKEFKQNKKENCFNPEINFLLHSDGIVTKEEAEILKIEHPELVIQNFKTVPAV